MNKEQVLQELSFRTSRSSGSGGQHVNKVETRVEALLDVDNSLGLSPKEKKHIHQKLENHITKEGILQTSSQEHRSQSRNKADAQRKLLKLLQKAIVPPKKRKPVRRLTANPRKRLKNKRVHSEKKALRKKPHRSDYQ